MATPVQDFQPRALAELVRHMGDAVAVSDGELAAILRDAQHALEELAWNRYARHVTRQGERRSLVRRHQQGTARRTLLEGYTYTRLERLASRIAPEAGTPAMAGRPSTGNPEAHHDA